MFVHPDHDGAQFTEGRTLPIHFTIIHLTTGPKDLNKVLCQLSFRMLVKLLLNNVSYIALKNSQLTPWDKCSVSALKRPM